MKKLVSAFATVGLVLASSAAVAAPQARVASTVSADEDLGGASTVWIVLLFAAIAAGLILVLEGGDEDPVLPVSP